MAARIKKGDMVFVNCGKDIGKTGEVLKMLGIQLQKYLRTEVLQSPNTQELADLFQLERSLHNFYMKSALRPT